MPCVHAGPECRQMRRCVLPSPPRCGDPEQRLWPQTQVRLDPGHGQLAVCKRSADPAVSLRPWTVPLTPGPSVPWDAHAPWCPGGPGVLCRAPIRFVPVICRFRPSPLTLMRVLHRSGEWRRGGRSTRNRAQLVRQTGDPALAWHLAALGPGPGAPHDRPPPCAPPSIARRSCPPEISWLTSWLT